ncbi:hypothetical protein KW785_03115 [Candidatus Parcubacteria bacterium]|nr:hypothetical protein [Candidatus Parcubacteria bacterium]
MNPENPEENLDEPLKQIRTFQGDMAEALKHKGESVISLSERERAKREAKEAQRHPAPAPLAPPPTPEPVAPHYTPDPRPAPVPEPITVPTPTIYADDPERPEGHVVRTLLLIVGTVVLLGLGGGGAWYAYTQYQVKTALPDINIPVNQFATPQSTFNINTSTLTRETLINVIRTERGASVPTGSIHKLELREGQGESAELLTTERFLVHYLETEAPASLIRAFDPLFMLATLGASPGEASAHTFMIVKLDSFENAFPGMLLWEATLSKDLLPLFAPDSIIEGVASSTVFSDITIQNKDARVLKNPQGKTVLLYSFYDNNYLIITDNELSLRQIISAMNARKTVR